MVKTTKRPWGMFKQFAFNEKSTVKILIVEPNHMLSLQKHKNRKEMWYFLTEGYVQLGKKKKKVKKGEIVNVRKGEIHRIFSKGKAIVVLEVAFGEFDEKDEIRIEDKYGRK